MIIKDKTYYKSFHRRIKYLHRRVDYCIKQANIWKDIYRLTKGIKVYIWLNKIANKMNNRYVRKGTKIAMEALRICEEEFIDLDKYISDKIEL